MNCSSLVLPHPHSPTPQLPRQATQMYRTQCYDILFPFQWSGGVDSYEPRTSPSSTRSGGSRKTGNQETAETRTLTR
jgi:hypothetical protein